MARSSTRCLVADIADMGARHRISPLRCYMACKPAILDGDHLDGRGCLDGPQSDVRLYDDEQESHYSGQNWCSSRMVQLCMARRNQAGRAYLHATKALSTFGACERLLFCMCAQVSLVVLLALELEVARLA